MNKILLSSLILLLFTMTISAQEVTTKQLHLITKRTADWCPKCGDYGWTLFKNLEKKLDKSKALVWAIHHSGSLINSTSAALDDSIFGGFGQPIFWLDDADLLVDADNYVEAEQLVLDVVNSGLFGDGYIGVGMNIESNQDNTINIATAVKTFENIAGNSYRLGIYLVNDSLVSFQQNIGLDAVHSGVVTKSLIPEKLGQFVFSAPIAKDAEVKMRWENIDLGLPGNVDRNNYRIAALLWAKDSGGTTRFFNGNVVNVGSALGTSNQDISKIDEITVFLNQNQDLLFIKSDDDVNEIIQTNIYNSVGLAVKHVFNRQGNANATIEFPDALSPGVYYFKASSAKGEKAYSFLAY